jgi:hypothetical protein
MADTPNPLDALISSTLDQQQPSDVPDTSSLPVSSRQIPQPPTQAQPQQQTSSGYQGPRPILLDFLQGMISPRTVPGQIDATGVQGPARPISRAATMEEFLGNFIGALGQGFAASGHGPGAFARGFGAAATAPLQQQQQRAQFQTEQEERQAQTQMTQEQAAALPAQRAAQLAGLTAQPRFDPDTKAYLGQMNDAQFQNYLKGQGAASTTARSKQAIAELNQLAGQGKVAFIKPAVGGGFAAYDKQGNLMRVLEGAIDPAQLQKISSTTEWKSDGAGGFMALPKTTVSGPAQSLQSKVPALGAPQAQPPVSGFPKTAGATSAQPSASGGRRYYGAGPVFAMDPQTGQQVLSTPQEVASKGLTNPVPVKQTDIEKEKSVSSMISDVQLNKSRYQTAMDQMYREPVTAAQGAALHELTPEKLGMDLGSYLSINVPELVQKAMNAEAFSQLSKTQKQAVVGYYSTLASVPSYQKALTNIGRANKEMMDLELRTIPTPIMDRESFHTLLDRFQGNIDQVGQRTVRMPGIPTVQEVRAKYEPASRQNAGFQIPKPF